MNQVKHHEASASKSVEKTLSILCLFDEVTPMLRTSDVAMRLDMNLSTASRHLNTLLDWGFLQRNEFTGYYSPGLKLISLAGVALRNNEVYRHSYAELTKISFQYNIHSHMAVPRGVDIIHLISCSCENTKELYIPMGQHQPMYCSAMGRAILAFMPPVKIQEILKNSDMRKRTADTKVDIEEILQALDEVRKIGYCLLVNELFENKASLAAPVFDRDGVPVAAISVSTSKNSLSQPARRNELAKVMKQASIRISGQMGYYPRYPREQRR